MEGPILWLNNQLVLKCVFVVIGAHSKWLEVIAVPSTTAAAKTKALRSIFSTCGLPESLVSCTGSAFTSNEFKTFLKENETGT